MQIQDQPVALLRAQQNWETVQANTRRADLLHWVHEASVLCAEAHKVDWQGEVVHVVGDPGVG